MRVQGMETSSDHRCPAEMGIFNCDVVWAGYGGRQNSRFVVAKISRGGEDFPWHFLDFPYRAVISPRCRHCSPTRRLLPCRAEQGACSI